MEGDIHGILLFEQIAGFYPRPPGGGRPLLEDSRQSIHRGFYPRPPGGGRPGTLVVYNRVKTVSIHALRVEGDVQLVVGVAVDLVSIHALRVEGDMGGGWLGWVRFGFYPRPPGGGRLPADRLGDQNKLFLSTPSGWRATYRLCRQRRKGRMFLSTPSGWRATSPGRRLAPGDQVSIHALRVEGDRQVVGLGTKTQIKFLSTPSGWRATLDKEQYMRQVAVSIHALRVEGDNHWRRREQPRRRFLSTPSGWRATRVALYGWRCWIVSIHALRVEGDSK